MMKNSRPEWLHELPDLEREFFLALRALPEPEQTDLLTAARQWLTWVRNGKDPARLFTAGEISAWVLARVARLRRRPRGEPMGGVFAFPRHGIFKGSQ